MWRYSDRNFKYGKEKAERIILSLSKDDTNTVFWKIEWLYSRRISTSASADQSDGLCSRTESQQVILSLSKDDPVYDSREKGALNE